MAAWNVPIIGDSLSDATRQYGDWQRVNLGTEAANIARQNQAEQYWNSQVAERDQEAFRRQQIEEQRRLNQEAIAREENRYRTTRADAAARDALSAQLEREKIMASLVTNASRPDPNVARLEQYHDQQAQQMAANGEIDSAAHALTLFPTLPKPIAEAYARTSAQRRANIEGDDSIIQAAADELNRYQALKRQQDELPKGGFFGQSAETKAKAAKIASDLAVVLPRYKQIVDPKNPISQKLRLDEATNTWIPLTPVRPWKRQAQTATGTAGVPAWQGAPAPPPQPVNERWGLPPAPSSYTSEAEARAAGHTDGDTIILNGRRAQLTPD